MPLPFTARSLDPDAAAFCARSGASDRAALSAFVRGVKDLGLWDSMVCWPLRSTQNAGTGTTVHSLGGLGSYDGSAVGGPAWTADGLTFDGASTEHITTALDVAGLRKFTAMVATDPSTYSNLDAMLGAWGTTNYLAMRRSSATSIDFIVSSGGTKVLATSGRSEDWRVYGWGTQGANTIATESGAQIATHAFVPDQTGSQTLNIGILATPTNSPYNGVIAWVMFTKDAELTTAQQLSVYTLYKQTLGTGLGLP
jgi:hypothetical protein